MPREMDARSTRSGSAIDQRAALEHTKHPVQPKVSLRVRVWWPPTDEAQKTDYGGMYWPALVLRKSKQSRRCDQYEVAYDNGEKELVDPEMVSPFPEVDFGKEKVGLRVGEFCEVFNNSKTDPAAWLARVKACTTNMCTVEYPFHDSNNERVSRELIRRARVFDNEVGEWKMVKAFQTWEDGEVITPTELELVSLAEYEADFTAKVQARKTQKQATTAASRTAGVKNDSSEEKAGPRDKGGDHSSLSNTKTGTHRQCVMCRRKTLLHCACGAPLCNVIGRSCYHDHLKMIFVGGAKRRKSAAPRAAN